MKRALLTTIQSDSHSWNLVYMELFLCEQGFLVENLGVSPSPDLVLDQIHRFNPDLVVVSTVNGHGYLEGADLVRNIKRQIPSLQTVIGGKLSTDPAQDKQHCASLLEAGFDAVFGEGSSREDFLDFLHGIGDDAYVR